MLRVAIQGNLKPFLEEQADRLKRATSEGVLDAATEIRDKLRSQTRRAGLGKGLEKAWRFEDFPRRKDSRNKAAYIFSKSVRLHRAFAEGGVVRAARVEWIAIPTPAGKRFAKGGAPAGRNSRRRRWSNVERAEQRFGRLRFVRTGPDSAILVAEKAAPKRKAGVKRRRRRKAAQGRKRRGKVLFTLHRQVTLPRALNLEILDNARVEAMTRRALVGSYQRAGLL